MSKLFWQVLKAAPAIVGASLFSASSALAQTATIPETTTANREDETLEQINRYSSQEESSPSLPQVTNVNQLRDVSPTDWAYEALRSLVDRYGCIVGYPNQTYRGGEALSRYEFAAGLNACLNQIERLIASSEAVTREDIETLQRLMQEFEAELATIGGRVDNLEGRVAFLEDNQFSTTTKLNGEVIFAAIDAFGEDDDTQTTLSDRVRLNFDTSFTGEDRLRTRLEAGNVPDLSDSNGFDMTRVGFDDDNENDIELSDLYYRFPVGERVTAYVGTTGLDLDDIFDVLNPTLESSGTGALSRFSRRDPLVFRGTEGAGAGANVELIEDRLTLTALYLTDDAADPEEGEGLFNGSYSAGAQVGFSLGENLDLTATYVRSYQTDDSVNLTGSTGSEIGAAPFTEIIINEDGEEEEVAIATSADKVGIGANYLLGERFNIGLWGSVAFAHELGGDDDATLFSVGGNFSFLDLGKEGAVLSIAGGIPPKLTDNDGGEEDEDTSVLIEALYKYPISDNILITPGAYVVLNPEHDDDNDTVVVGVIRTTFSF